MAGRKTTIVIVEDEFSIALDIEMRLKKMDYNVIGSTDNADSAYVLVEEESPDLVLMDIHLKGEKSGIEAAKHLFNELNIPIVFLTAQKDAKTFNEALEAEPYGYILKPFQDVDLKNAIELALRKHNTDLEKKKVFELEKSKISGQIDNIIKNESFFVKDKTAVHRLDLKNILYLEALDNYTHIYTTDGRYTVHAFLKDVTDKLPANSFMRVHRSYVVAINQIQTIKENNIVIGKNNVPVSRSYRQALLEKINLL
ncbi:MAG: LytTR family transcriptional regulator DNA-binding domain-containing protein [Bacteroidota bacterium]|nr:LytTR family transcriptional regulator DNA-binding domain-containing protein [Bacteroidota bacterium]